MAATALLAAFEPHPRPRPRPPGRVVGRLVDGRVVPFEPLQHPLDVLAPRADSLAPDPWVERAEEQRVEQRGRADLAWAQLGLAERRVEAEVAQRQRAEDRDVLRWRLERRDRQEREERERRRSLDLERQADRLEDRPVTWLEALGAGLPVLAGGVGLGGLIAATGQQVSVRQVVAGAGVALGLAALVGRQMVQADNARRADRLREHAARR